VDDAWTLLPASVAINCCPAVFVGVPVFLTSSFISQLY